MEHWATIGEERMALADLLDGLTPAQWRTPSLCHAWTVRDVAAHLIVPHELSMPAFVLAFARARGSFDRANVAMTARMARLSLPELVDALRTHAGGRFTPPGYGSEAPFTDVLVHGEDIRVPLGMSAERPATTWTPVLEFLVSPKARRVFVGRSLAGYRLMATDTGWEHGDGPEVRGPSRSLALAMAGRRAGTGDLEGAGTVALLGATTG